MYDTTQMVASLHLDARKGAIFADVAIDTYHDHRMAMAFAPLALSVPIVINDASSYKKISSLNNLSLRIAQ